MPATDLDKPGLTMPSRSAGAEGAPRSDDPGRGYLAVSVVTPAASGPVNGAGSSAKWPLSVSPSSTDRPVRAGSPPISAAGDSRKRPGPACESGDGALGDGGVCRLAARTTRR